ncbi:AmmeMemoRadiSam system radical SAM enzyme [Myxococcota bacterium]
MIDAGLHKNHYVQIPGGESGGRGVVCQLCPRGCRIPPGHSGDCRVRINVKGKLIASTYGRPCTATFDPIEKKPLFHVLPGTRILSIATVGCNLHCRNCQNHNISQTNPWDERIHVRSLYRGAFGIPPEGLVRAALNRRCPSIACTYTEPMVYYEYTRAIGEHARAAGIKTVTVTAGYINAAPLRELCRVVDASNLDIKSMNPAAFLRNSGGILKHILRGAVIAREQGVWLEITSLVIPTYNDTTAEIRKLCRFVKRELGAHTPIHFSRFRPLHQLRNLPPTPTSTLERARKIAQDEGILYPYVGNLPGNDGEHTYCPDCHRVVVRRVGYTIRGRSLTADGRCGFCGRAIEGVWK